MFATDGGAAARLRCEPEGEIDAHQRRPELMRACVTLDGLLSPGDIISATPFLAALRRAALCAVAALPLGTQANDAAHWQYSGEYGPARWGALRPEYALCDRGQRQSPIDIGRAPPADPAAASVPIPRRASAHRQRRPHSARARRQWQPHGSGPRQPHAAAVPLPCARR